MISSSLRPIARLLAVWCFFAGVSVFGQTWTDITANLPAAPRVGTGQSIASTGSDLFVLSSPNGVLRSRDNGATWQAVNTVTGNANNLSTFGSRSLDAIGSTIWAGGEPGSLSVTGGVLPLHRLTTGTDAWNPSFAGATIPAVIDVVAFDSTTNTHWAAGSLGGIFKSTDGGATWVTAMGNLPAIGFRSLVAHNGKVIAGNYTSVDGGITWSNKNLPLVSVGFLTRIGDNVCVIGGGSTTLTDGVYFSRDMGVTWQLTQVDIAASLKLLKNTCADSTTMFSGGTTVVVTTTVSYVSTVAFSQNGGMTWDDLPATGLGVGVGKQVERLARHGNFLFALTGENKLFRLDLNTVALTPTLKVAVAPKPDKKITGGTLTMKVFAGGPGTLTYQWKKGTADVPGQTTDTLSIANAQPSDTGDYTCVVTSGATSVTSAVARGTVVDRIEGRYDPTYARTDMGGTETGTPFLQSDGSLLVTTTGGAYRLGPEGGRTDTRSVASSLNGQTLDVSGRIVFVGGTGSTHRVRRVLTTAGFPDDASFPLLSANNILRGVTELPGSGYLVWGDFSTMGPVGGTQSTVARLVLVNYDGSLNTTFNTNITPVHGGASAVPYVAPDKTVWIGVNAGFKKVNASGSPVVGFTDYQPGASTNFISSASLLKSGKMLVTLTNSGASRPFKLMNPDGTFDATFNTANLVLNSTFTAVAEQADNRIVLAGNFTTFGTNACNGRIMRISPEGVFDGTFYNATGFSAAGCSGLVYDPRGYLLMANVSNNATTGSFQDSATIGDTIGRNFVRVFATLAPSTGTPYASWQTGFTFPVGLSDPDDDADGDGLSNLLEYAFASHPLNPSASQNPVAGAPVTVGPDEFPTITFRRNTTATGVTVSVNVAASPAFATDLGSTLVSTVALGEGVEQVTYRSNASTVSQPKQFLSVTVSVP